MTKIVSYSAIRACSVAAIFGLMVAGCSGGGGGQDPILGSGGIVPVGPAPTVTAVSPAANALAVPTNLKKLTAAFSKAMDATSLTAATFTLACPAGTAIAGGTVTYLAAGSVATSPT